MYPPELVLADVPPGATVKATILLLDGGGADAMQCASPAMSNGERMKGAFEPLPAGFIANKSNFGYSAKQQFVLSYTAGSDDATEREFLEFPVPGDTNRRIIRVPVLCMKQSPPLSFFPATLVISDSEDSPIVRKALCRLRTGSQTDIDVIAKPQSVEVTISRQSPEEIMLTILVDPAKVNQKEPGAIVLGSRSDKTIRGELSLAILPTSAL